MTRPTERYREEAPPPRSVGERPLIQLSDVRKIYRIGASEVPALGGVSLTIEQGEFVALIGPSGSGKSTLLHVLGFLDRPDFGAYRFAGHATELLTDNQLAALRSRTVGFVFQSFHLLGRQSAAENVALPMVYSGADRREERVAEGLRLVGLKDRADHRPNELSGGQQQRVAVARAVVNDPLVLLADEPTGNLDGRSRGEVLALLKSLSARGITVVLVTHDPEVAAEAGRVVRLKDGLIVSDDRLVESGDARTISPSFPPMAALPKARRGFGAAELREQGRVAFWAVWSHKLRSALTVLGMLIGIGSIVALMSVSRGFLNELIGKAETEGADLVQVRRNWHKFPNVPELHLEDAELIRTECPSVAKVSPLLYKDVDVRRGKKSIAALLLSDVGELPWELKPRPGLKPERWLNGRWITPADDRARARVIVLSQSAAQKLFGEEEPVGGEVRINKIPLEVVGVEQDAKESQIFGGRSRVVVPLNTALRRMYGERTVEELEAKAVSVDAVQDARREIILALRKRYGWREGKEEDYNVQTLRGRIEAFRGDLGKFSMFVYAVAAISLLVGGIGIMNIMLVSVTERTREIGLRKALGARKADILAQFLVEAVVLSFLGALAGVALGYSLAWAASLLIHVTPSLSSAMVGSACAFSGGVGLAFGFWPAWRAASLSPIEALRTE